MSHFEFLKTEWPELHDSAVRTEELAYPDPRACCFYARRALELAVAWMFRNDGSLTLPYQDHLSALLHEPTFRTVVGPRIFSKARILKDLGNQAVHSRIAIRQLDAVTAVRELFQFCFWLARNYSRGKPPDDQLLFDTTRLPKTSSLPPQTVSQLQSLEKQLAEKDQKVTELLGERSALDQELQELRAEIAKVRAANAARPDTHDYSEAETRDYFIDLLLREAGWILDPKKDFEVEVAGMPNTGGVGYVDYVLWGDDGKPLGLVEAKRTKRDPHAGQQQAKLYADCLERQYSQRPVIFFSNGYQHWMWDDTRYPSREIQGFLKKEELELIIQRRAQRTSLSKTEIDTNIVERYYQWRAIRKISEVFEKDNDRKSLLVMATGAGKTRTIIALCDLLMRCNWVKRVLFLADRVALVNQAVNAFKRHFPASSPVNLVTEKDKEGRVCVSTYPTMMGLIDEVQEQQRRFSVGHFDLIIIDEAHRSVYQKYRAIFEYFDSLLIGLTATPKDEVDRNTYSLFDLEPGVPTDSYSLEDAVKDRYLVPPVSVSVPLKFQREGINYDELPEEEKEQWDTLEWDETGAVPSRVEAQAVNKWLFNKDTVDKVLENMMTKGVKVAGGDRLGKTIIFAKNHDHAQFIADRFDVNYPQYKGSFARVIDVQVEYAQTLIDDFSGSDKAPHIAISIDMLDTGIDIPEIVNLVFFKLVRSKTKFWQMMGRGTRLREDLFGPGQDKAFFFVFDYCQNLEFFSQNLPTSEGSVIEPLSKKLFGARLELIGELDHKWVDRVAEASSIEDSEQGLREYLAEHLRKQISAMNTNNFLVRPHRALVETFSEPEAWREIKEEDAHRLAINVAGLPTEMKDEDEEAKRFDLLMFRIQLAMLRSEPAFERLRDQVREIAGLLEEKDSIPMVREQMSLIQEIQTDEFWQDITLPLVENARRKLRMLVKLIEKAKRKIIYSDFEDTLGEATGVDLLPTFDPGVNMERFKAKARQFLKAHYDSGPVRKLRMNIALSTQDLEDLERLLIQNGIGSAQEIDQAKQESPGFGIFLLSLVGLDREAAKQAMNRFLSGKTITGNQIEFLNLIIDHLAENGVLDPVLLYGSPYTDISPKGPEGVFTSQQVEDLISVLSDIQKHVSA